MSLCNLNGGLRILVSMLAQNIIFVDYFSIFADFFSGREIVSCKFVTICLEPPKTSRRPTYSILFIVINHLKIIFRNFSYRKGMHDRYLGSSTETVAFQVYEILKIDHEFLKIF